MPRLCRPELRAKILQGREPVWITRSKRSDYWRMLFLSTPDWCDRDRLRAMNREARRRGLVLDHEIPLVHPLVCGLTVPANMRLLTRAENAARSNRWWEYTPDLFTFPQQLELRLVGYL